MFWSLLAVIIQGRCRLLSLFGFFPLGCPKVDSGAVRAWGQSFSNFVCELSCYADLAHEDGSLVQKVRLLESHEPKAHGLVLNVVL